MSTETILLWFLYSLITINQREEEPLKSINEYRNHNNQINKREEEPLKSINEYRNHNNQSTRRGTIKINQ